MAELLAVILIARPVGAATGKLLNTWFKQMYADHGESFNVTFPREMLLWRPSVSTSCSQFRRLNQQSCKSGVSFNEDKIKSSVEERARLGLWLSVQAAFIV